MTDFFKSAFSNIFSKEASSSTTTTASDEFVGRSIAVGNYKLKVTKLLAEGGYAIVYVAQDITNGVEYAVKRMFAADKTANRSILEEINFLKQVSNHPNIIKFIAAACEDKDLHINNNPQRNEYLVLTELCKGGSLIDFIRQNELNNEQVLQVFYQIAKAVQYLHNQDPPIIHRDIKIDNFLISSEGALKLCDFGSATYIEYAPDDTWTANQRSLAEDEIAKQTTPMYRAPEMLDLYSNYPINKQADIWALGCILYVLCFNRHPYEDSAKLRIINGNYTIPVNSQFEDYHDLIRCMFNIDPRKRPTIDEIVYHLENISQTKSIKFSNKLRFLLNNNKSFNSYNGINQSSGTFSSSSGATTQHVNGNSSNSNDSSSKWIGSAANILIGGIKTIKDASSKVIDTVQQSINRNDIDISYITPRLIVMPCPTEGIEATAFGNHIDLVKEAIERRHSLHYCIYNLSNKHYTKEKFTKVVDIGNLSSSKSPYLTIITKICMSIHRYLEQNPKNVCVVHCTDGKALSAIIACSLLLIYGVADDVNTSERIFNLKRSCGASLNASQLRYLTYINKLVNQVPPYLSSPNEYNLNTITLNTIPLFNRFKNGCTPYVEVFCKEQRVFTNFNSYESLRKYTADESNILFNINCKLYGDVTIVIYHAKSLLGGGKLISIRICQLQFHTGFLTSNKLKFNKSELDGLDTADKYHDSFSVNVDLDMRNTVSSLAQDEAWNSTLLHDYKNPAGLFHTDQEIDDMIELLKAANKPYSDDSPDPVSVVVGQSKFFSENSSATNGPRIEQIGQSTFFTAPSESTKLDAPPPAATTTKNLAKQVKSEDLFADNDNKMKKLNLNDNNQNKKPSVEKIANLLDFDDSEKNLVGEATTVNSTKKQSNMDLLVDIHETSVARNNQVMLSAMGNIFSDVENTAPSITTTQQSSFTNNLVDFGGNDDFFTFDTLASNRGGPAASSNPTINNPNSIFDPLGDFNTPIITPTPSSSNLKPNSSQTNFQQQQFTTQTKADPFADFGSFKQTSSVPNNLGAANNKGSTGNFGFMGSASSKPVSPQESPMHKPNYNLGPNTFVNKPATTTTTNAQAANNKPKPANTTSSFNFTNLSNAAASKNKSAFGDFLPDEFGTKNFDNTTNKPLKDLKRETNSKDVDPDKARVAEWTEGKKKNIRALLCSMDKVLWDGADRWKQVGMHELVSADQVKKVYRKAVLAVHPDKLSDHPQLNLARLIFIELNAAWEAFEQEGQKNLF